MRKISIFPDGEIHGQNLNQGSQLSPRLLISYADSWFAKFTTITRSPLMSYFFGIFILLEGGFLAATRCLVFLILLLSKASKI